MKENYPFFQFILKDTQQKGHIKSMNMIHDIVANNNNINHVLHMEDDFHFVSHQTYISNSLYILETESEIKQVLFNRNYMEEEPYKRKLPGGIIKQGQVRYVIHEHAEPDTPLYKSLIKKYEDQGGLQVYWPHFSFRPSVVDASVYRKLGEFSNTSHFEMQYARDFVKAGYKSAFLDNFSCIHIGKKTWEQGLNSYNLNSVEQFGKKTSVISIKIVTPLNEPTNKELKAILNKYVINYEVEYVKDINIQTILDLGIFKNNNFNYIKSIVDEYYTHYKILKEMETEFCVVISNNVVLPKDFDVYKLILKLKESKVGIIELGDNIIGGYAVTKQVAKHLIDHININGIVDNIFEGLPIKKLIDVTKKIDTFEKIDGYTFYSRLDSYGNDIRFMGKQDYKTLAKLCNADPTCVAFNTNGYSKYKVNNNLCELHNSSLDMQGLYVKN
jgi:hypothetical protein